MKLSVISRTFSRASDLLITLLTLLVINSIVMIPAVAFVRELLR